MAQWRYIGDDRKEAIDWLQDLLEITRPQAETAMISMLHDGAAITTDSGIMLSEDEEEIERRMIKVQGNQLKNWSRLHFRNHNRSRGKLSLKARRKMTDITNFSDEADEMLFSNASTPLPDTDEEK